MINSITITGADDNISPQDPINLSKLYPFVEWGLLFSPKKQGTPRYPTQEWLEELITLRFKDRMLSGFKNEVKFSMHLCGTWVDLAFEGSSLVQKLLEKYNFFQRIQFNCRGHKKYKIDYPNFLPSHKTYIFQHEPTNPGPFQTAKDAGLKCAILFDDSGGKGILPTEWPYPDLHNTCGYAGGLGPDNLYQQMMSIHLRSGMKKVWIDMESGVRTNNNFDLSKVLSCLEAYKDFNTFRSQNKYSK